ncbi:hypothetical protein [Zhihengliuella sp.]|uniref:hypothetical protein n=1 Tax=Zhihengliuella sp. TaxID=1954483 RepID=UPI0028124835|nr:hypothetical protein [Zhihengliuella sp.]
MDAEALLAGPRGRRFVMEAVLRAGIPAEPEAPGGPEAAPATFGWQLGPLEPFAGRPATAKPAALRGLSEADVMGSLVDSVFSAMYWQPPHPEDVLLAEPGKADELRPAAEALLEHPFLAALDRPLLAGPGRLTYPAAHIDWIDELNPERRVPPHLSRTDAQGRDKLERWRRHVDADVRRARNDRPRDVCANFGGDWWATPAMVDLLVTTPLPGADALAPGAEIGIPLLLHGIEDSFELTAGTVTVLDLAPAAAPRVYEIDSPDAWARLVAAFPLDVTPARRHEYYQVTGLDVAWFMPDWQQVADQYDAVHVTVGGYLATATHPIPLAGHGLPGAHTMLAGWDPDQTYWFDAPLRLIDRFEVELFERGPDGDPALEDVWRRAAT